MVNDTILKAAAGEAEQHYFDALSEKYPEDHGFSLRFEKKMAKIIRRANAPVRYRIGRIAVAAVLALVMLFGALVAFSPKVRADVVRWIRETFEIFERYIPNETTPPDTRYDYILTGIDASTLMQEIERKNGKVLIYKGEGNRLIRFTYTYGSENNEIFVESQGYTITSVMIGNNTADIYIAQVEGKNNTILWKDKATNTMLSISANVNQEMLMNLAESVQKKES